MRKNSGGMNMLNPKTVSKRFYFEEIRFYQWSGLEI